jgi:hypothetical protein
MKNQCAATALGGSSTHESCPGKEPGEPLDQADAGLFLFFSVKLSTAPFFGLLRAGTVFDDRYAILPALSEGQGKRGRAEILFRSDDRGNSIADVLCRGARSVGASP